MAPEFSLVCPCYNEARILEQSVDRILSVLPRVADTYELILSDDGSTDGTGSMIHVLSEKLEPVRSAGESIHLGKGGTLTRGFRVARGEICAFLDVDLELTPEYLVEMAEKVRSGADIVIGSKCLGPAHGGRRSLARKISTGGYNFVVRSLLGSRLADHQAGVKTFHRRVVDKVLPEMKSLGWIWDTEFLVRAQSHGFHIEEIPVEVTHQRQSKMNVPLDAMRMFMGVLGLFRQGIRVRKGRAQTA